MRSSGFSYGRSWRSISRKPVIFPIVLFRSDGGARPNVGQRLGIVGRHHLDELRQAGVPVVEDLARARAAGAQQVPLDQDADALGIEAQQIAHARIGDADRALLWQLGMV